MAFEPAAFWGKANQGLLFAGWPFLFQFKYLYSRGIKFTVY